MHAETFCKIPCWSSHDTSTKVITGFRVSDVARILNSVKTALMPQPIGKKQHLLHYIRFSILGYWIKPNYAMTK